MLKFVNYSSLRGFLESSLRSDWERDVSQWVAGPLELEAFTGAWASAALTPPPAKRPCLNRAMQRSQCTNVLLVL